MRRIMAQKSFLSWVGFKSEHSVTQSLPGTTSQPSGALDRIRELESQIADLRSRKDITSLTREEFEILATETAMNLVKTAQQREKIASTQAAKLLTDSSTIAQEATTGAEAKAKSILAAAESRGRKYLTAAESEGGEIKAEAERTAHSLTVLANREAELLRSTTSKEVEAMLSTKRREAVAITSAAKSEADSLIEEATHNIANYRSWLVSAVAESERLYKIQTQSLSAAQQAIDQSRQRLAHAFEKLSAHITDVDNNLGNENRPTSKEFLQSKPIVAQSSEAPAINALPATTTSKKRAMAKSAHKSVKPVVKKVAKRPAKKVVKKVAKKSARR